MKRLLILLMLVSQPAWAGWVELGSAGAGTEKAFTHYIDPETVRKTPNGRRAWMMNDFERPQPDPSGSYRSSKELEEFDCAGERNRTLQGSAFSGQMGTGLVVTSLDSAGRWLIVSPGSVAEAQLKAVCRMPLR
jgi:hypothetical protein